MSKIARRKLSFRGLLLVCLLLPVILTGCLRGPADAAGLRFGYAVDPDPLAADPVYAALLNVDANIVTAENHMKWSLIHPGPDEYDFAAADQIVAHASANGQQVRGHTLVWHQQLPSWLENGTWSRASLIEVLRDHIHTVVGHFRDEYPGVVRQWDVVNEAFQADGSRRPTIWQQVIGDDYIALAFQFAHDADPEAALFLNDFYDQGIVTADAVINGGPAGVGASAGRSECAEVPKCAATRSLAASLVAAGVPIDGIGFQGHIFGTAPADYDVLASWTAPLGVSWAITELDVAIGTSQADQPEVIDAQAHAFASVVEDCLRATNCDTVVVWGVSDAHSWLPAATFGLLDHGTLYWPDYRPKPAVGRLLHLLRSHAAS